MHTHHRAPTRRHREHAGGATPKGARLKYSCGVFRTVLSVPQAPQSAMAYICEGMSPTDHSQQCSDPVICVQFKYYTAAMIRCQQGMLIVPA